MTSMNRRAAEQAPHVQLEVHSREPDVTPSLTAPGAGADPHGLEARLTLLESGAPALAHFIRALAHGLEKLSAQDAAVAEEVARSARLVLHEPP
ncbi:hypothetical protein [Streptomyces sp.]|uniref:hypothetical protein n=1 Tax=Streptomyces sp. TaxID=1931 RepID=UPI002F408A4E